jgi:DNA polymerase III delta prime subunit
MNDSWSIKYRPRKTTDLLFNLEQCNELFLWLKMSKNKRKKSCMLVRGNIGIGKTVSINIILRAHKYYVNRIDINTIENNKYDTLHSLIFNRYNMMNINNNTKTSKVVVVIDNINQLNGIKKNLLLRILRENNKKKVLPIILISNEIHNKLISQLKSITKDILFNKPWKNHIRIIISRIEGKKKIKYSELVKKELIKYVNYDITKLLLTLQDLYELYGRRINLRMYYDYIDTVENKDIDLDLFNASSEVIYNYTDIYDNLLNYEMDNKTIPLMVYDNYINIITSRLYKADNKNDLINEISEYISLGDTIDNYINTYQEYSLGDVYGFITCTMPSYNIKKGSKGRLIKKRLMYPKIITKIQQIISS